MIDASGLQSGDDPEQMDPLFFRGKSPVLGQDVEVRTAGALPAEFPSTGPAPGGPMGAPQPPRPPGAPGAGPSFPDLNLPEFPEFPGEPGFPGFPQSSTPPTQRTPWWSLAMELAGLGQSAFQNVKKLADTPNAGGMDLPPWMTPGEATAFSLTGASDQPWWSANPDRFSVAGTPNAADVLDPGDFKLLDSTQLSLGGPAEEGSGISLQGAGGPVQLAGGIASMVESKPGSPGFAFGAANTVGGLAETGATFAPELFGGLEGISPVMGIASIPPLLTTLLTHYFGPDEAHWPEGWQPLPGNANQAVDPATGRILQYSGNGVYGWSDQTLQGKPATPEQLTQWQVYPLGQLAALPDYSGISAKILDAQSAAATQAQSQGQAAPVPFVPAEVAGQAGTAPDIQAFTDILLSGGGPQRGGDFTPDPATQVQQLLGAPGVADIPAGFGTGGGRGGDFPDELTSSAPPDWFSASMGLGDRG